MRILLSAFSCGPHRGSENGVGWNWAVEITFSGIRHPTLLGRLPVPLVLGPLGGGERAPFALRRGFG